RLGLGRFLGVAHAVVDFEPGKRSRLCWIEPDLLCPFDEEVTFFWIVVEAAFFHPIGPAFDFVRRFLCAVAIEPIDYLLIARAVFDLRSEILALHTFKTEQGVIERTIEMVFADVARHERAAFVDRAAKNRVTANPNARTAR